MTRGYKARIARAAKFMLRRCCANRSVVAADERRRIFLIANALRLLASAASTLRIQA